MNRHRRSAWSGGVAVCWSGSSRRDVRPAQAPFGRGGRAVGGCRMVTGGVSRDSCDAHAGLSADRAFPCPGPVSGGGPGAAAVRRRSPSPAPPGSVAAPRAWGVRRLPKIGMPRTTTPYACAPRGGDGRTVPAARRGRPTPDGTLVHPQRAGTQPHLLVARPPGRRPGTRFTRPSGARRRGAASPLCATTGSVRPR